MPIDPVIVIFGAAVRPDGTPSTALRRRVRSAYAFGRFQGNPLYVPTGAVGRHGASEASVMARLLMQYGVPADRILLEETGISTITSVRAVRRLLGVRSRRDQPIYAASSAYHLPRCVVLMRIAGMDVWACPARRSPAARTLTTRWYWRLREVAALPVDAFTMLTLRLTGRL